MKVIKLGSFSAAARQLHLSQPAVSMQIRELETRCGVQLIDRIGKHILSTAAGQDLLEYAEPITMETECALAAMHRHKAGCSGRVHLGTGPDPRRMPSPHAWTQWRRNAFPSVIAGPIVSRIGN